MAVKIRLRQMGRNNRQTYRLVAVDARWKRDGKYLENLGWYDPNREGENYSVNAERISYWLDQGAEPSLRAENLISKGAPDLFKKYQEKQMATRAKKVAKRGVSKKAAAPAKPVKAAKAPK